MVRGDGGKMRTFRELRVARAQGSRINGIKPKSAKALLKSLRGKAVRVPIILSIFRGVFSENCLVYRADESARSEHFNVSDRTGRIYL